MRVVIIEDEPLAAAVLKQAIEAWEHGAAQVIGVAENIRDSIELVSRAKPDLIFADIRLSDGVSFRIFEELDVACPVIFATAYDAHAIEAMENNAIDYILKPIEPARVAQALAKYQKLAGFFGAAPGTAAVGEERPSRIVARKGAAFVAVPIDRIAWFTTEHKLTLLVDREGKRFAVDEGLSELEKRLDRRRFFRLNRQYLVQVD